MADPIFFESTGPITLGEVATLAGVSLPLGVDGALVIAGVAPLETAGPSDLAYMDNAKYADALAKTRAGCILVSNRFATRAPAGGAAVLVTSRPYDTYAAVLARLYPGAMRPASAFGAGGVSPGSFVHPTARLEQCVTVDPGAVIGPHAEIGAGTIIGAQAVIGPQVRIGRDCAISPHVTVLNALIGNRVILHGGVRVGQDGFGFAMGSAGHRKVPQIGRVIIQDDVEIGANTTIDRGANRDTVIGEGTKIDNLVQIAHNVVIGRHCVIAAQTGLSGSATLEDFVALGGQVGVIGHVRIGMGAQVAATSNVNNDLEPGGRYGGTPAKPVREWFREVTALKKLAARSGAGKDD
jgi:UDP-3-O-[3-hydroxymyristoyl] glucosamine N-acyltransferase